MFDYEKEQIRLVRQEELIGPCEESARYGSLANATKSLILANIVEQECKFKVINGLPRLLSAPSAEGVKRIAELVSEMWPRGPASSGGFGESKSGVNVLYWGRHYPSGIRRAVTRASLYADKIYVINPFVDDFLAHPQASPLVEPQNWTAIYAAQAAFVRTLSPWIESGLVELVVNPQARDWQIGKLLVNQARDEMEAHNGKLRDEMLRSNQIFNAEAFLGVSAADRDSICERMRATPREREELIRGVSALQALDSDVVEVMQGTKARMLKAGTGASRPAVRMMSEALGAFIITDNAGTAAQLSQLPVKAGMPFQVVADSVSRLDLKFLNDVPPEFAVSIRQEGRFASFRQYLGDVFALSNAVLPPNARHEDRVAACHARLLDEYEKYQTEVKSLDSQLARSAFFAVPLFAGATLAATGSLSFAAFAKTCISGKLKALYDRWSKGKPVRGKPLGVFLQLQQGG